MNDSYDMQIFVLSNLFRRMITIYSSLLDDDLVVAKKRMREEMCLVLNSIHEIWIPSFSPCAVRESVECLLPDLVREIDRDEEFDRDLLMGDLSVGEMIEQIESFLAKEK